MGRVVVTGVAGALGRRVAARLSGRPGIEVVGLDVVAAPTGLPGVDFLTLDLADEAPEARAALDRAMDGAEALFHLAWRLSVAQGGDRAADGEVAAANRRALARVLEAADKCGVPALVHLSSATVYGAWPDNKIPLTEDARLRPNPDFTFAVSKAEAERAVSEWADAHPSVRVAVLRPSVTVGAGDRPLYQALGITGTPSSGDSSRPVQYLHVEDLASATVFAWDRGLTGVYNVAPDTGIPEEQARALAGGLARVALPDRVAASVSVLSWQLWRKGIPAEARPYAVHPWVVAPDRLQNAGWQAEYSSEEALVATDQRLHWDDLPPGRRQNYNLLILVGVLIAAAAGVTGLVTWLLRRRRAAARNG